MYQIANQRFELQPRHGMVQNTFESEPRFSFYRKPVSNPFVYKDITLRDAFNYITGPYAKVQTDVLRSLTNPKEKSQYKSQYFDYVTFSGRFRKRSNEGLIEHSGFICFDFDHVGDKLAVDDLKHQIIADGSLDVRLAFRSPSGDGLKVILAVEIAKYPHWDWFMCLSRYFETNYGVAPDPSGKDVARACFLPHDPECYLKR